MSKYTRKKRVRPEDQFVDFWHKLFVKAAPYARAIGVTLGTAVAVTLIVWSVTTYLDRRAQAATELFGRALKIYDAELISDDSAAKPPEEEPAVTRYHSEKERAEATLAELDALDKKSGHSDVAKSGALLRASALYDLGRYDDAAAAFERALGETTDPALRALAQEGIGVSREAAGKLDEALAAYRRLEPKSGDFYRDRALYDEARVYARKGDKKKAAELYREALAKVPGTALREEIQTRIALLEAP